MSADDKNAHFQDSYMITNDELSEIKKGGEMFPGKWVVDPEIDYCRVGAARVWIRPDTTESSFSLSFGFSKENGQFYVVTQQHDNRGDCSTAGMPFGTLHQALAMCHGSLLIIMKHAASHVMKQAAGDANDGYDTRPAGSDRRT